MFSREDQRRKQLVLDLGARPGIGGVDEKCKTLWANDLMRRDQGHDFQYEHPLAGRAKKIEVLSIEKTFDEADFFVIEINKKRRTTKFVDSCS